MMKTKNCIIWLWNATKGFRMAIAGNSLAGILHVSVSLLFVFACKQVIDAVTHTKRDILSSKGVSLNVDEILIALSISGIYDENAKKASEALKQLRDCDVHFTHIPSAGDIDGMRKLNINFTSEPQYPARSY